MIEYDFPRDQKVNILNKLASSDAFVESFGQPIKADYIESKHNPNTISQGHIYFYRIITERASTEIGVKVYSTTGYPTNEFSSYRLLSEKGSKIKRPGIYYMGYLRGDDQILIMERLSGETLDKKLSAADTNKMKLGILGNVIDELNKLKEIKSVSNKLVAIEPYTWIKEGEVSLTEFILKGSARPFRTMIEQVVDQAYVDKHLAWIKDHLDAIDNEALTMCQGDATGNNVIVSSVNEIQGVIDWEYSYYGPLSKDVADAGYSFLILNRNANSLANILDLFKTMGYDKHNVIFYMIMRTIIQAGTASKNGDLEKSKQLLELTDELKSEFKK